ncbi:MAG: DUF4230 domain-containing protein [Verrucomicrobiales bacterium]|jgi:hypothetical protein|nr:DUF4230 domain-containing protein [Verrucomicrobiales bacterium]
MKPKWQQYLVLTLCIVVVLYAVTWAFRSCVRSVAEAPKLAVSGVSKETVSALQGVSDVFVKVFNLRPQIHVAEQIIQAQSSPVAEFAVVQQDMSNHYEWHHKWLGSEKSIVIEGIFRAKAGFDLQQPFIIKPGANGGISVELPPAKILSVEQQGQLTFQDADGFWNKLSSEDRQHAINEFLLSAKQKAVESGLITQAEQQTEARIQQLVQRNGRPLMLKFRGTD